MKRRRQKKKEKKVREETRKICGWVETEGVTILGQCKDGGLTYRRKGLGKCKTYKWRQGPLCQRKPVSMCKWYRGKTDS